jgi:hypothetical protein
MNITKNGNANNPAVNNALLAHLVPPNWIYNVVDVHPLMDAVTKYNTVMAVYGAPRLPI